MSAQVLNETLRPLEALDALVARHGVWRVLAALPVVVLKRRREQVTLPHDLPPHLLRDIGLGADAGRGKSWELG